MMVDHRVIGSPHFKRTCCIHRWDLD